MRPVLVHPSVPRSALDDPRGRPGPPCGSGEALRFSDARVLVSQECLLKLTAVWSDGAAAPHQGAFPSAAHASPPTSVSGVCQATRAANEKRLIPRAMRRGSHARDTRAAAAALFLALCIAPLQQSQSDGVPPVAPVQQPQSDGVPPAPAGGEQEGGAGLRIAKRPVSAYILYHSIVRKNIQAEHRGESVKNITRLISAKWNALSAEGRAEYEAMARARRQEFLERPKLKVTKPKLRQEGEVKMNITRLEELVLDKDPRAMLALAACLTEGRGAPLDHARALVLLERAVQEIAQHTAQHVGDLAAAAAHAAAHEGVLADALFALGALHATGRGARLDLQEAQRFWTRAAQAGSVDAMFNLGCVALGDAERCARAGAGVPAPERAPPRAPSRKRATHPRGAGAPPG